MNDACWTGGCPSVQPLPDGAWQVKIGMRTTVHFDILNSVNFTDEGRIYYHNSFWGSQVSNIHSCRQKFIITAISVHNCIFFRRRTVLRNSQFSLLFKMIVWWNKFFSTRVGFTVMLWRSYQCGCFGMCTLIFRYFPRIVWRRLPRIQTDKERKKWCLKTSFQFLWFCCNIKH